MAQSDKKLQRQLMKQLASLRQQVTELEEFVQPNSLAIETSRTNEISLGAKGIPGSIEQTMEAVSVGVVAVDDRGRIVHVNRQTESLFGYHRDELQGKPVQILLPEHLHRIHQSHLQDFLLDPRTRPMSNGRFLAGPSASATG